MRSMGTLFGTDGIRAKVGSYPVTPECFLKMGWALGQWLGKGKVIIGKDTRLSGYMLESALQAGLSAAGIDVYLCGPLPTPAIAYLTQSLRAEAGLVISASHNPYNDNGLKIFSKTGLKLNQTQQDEIEEYYHQPMSVASSSQLGKAHRLNDAAGRYIEFLKSHFRSLNLKGLTIFLDCAHGAAYQIAPIIFKELNAHVEVFNDEPNGYNINLNAGVMHPEIFEEKVFASKPALAFSFDGDADRLSVYIEGRKLDANHILIALEKYYEDRYCSSLGVIGTILTNSCVEQYFKKKRVPYHTTDVGDRHLIYAALEKGWFVAGEPSGHFILADKLKTADALLAALAIADGYINHKINVDYFEEIAPLYPTIVYNYETKQPKKILAQGKISEKIQKIKNSNPEMKIIVRASGTEPVIRILCEGPDYQQLELIKTQLCELIFEYEQHIVMDHND
jgi:phosphoglucosamine mutase